VLNIVDESKLTLSLTKGAISLLISLLSFQRKITSKTKEKKSEELIQKVPYQNIFHGTSH